MLSSASNPVRYAFGVLLLIGPSTQTQAADELIIRNQNGSVRERVTKNPYTGGYDIREPNGRRVGTIERNQITGKPEARSPIGKRAVPTQKRN